MGGLVARSPVGAPAFTQIADRYNPAAGWYIQSSHFVGKIVTLDTPNHGSSDAELLRENLISLVPYAAKQLTSLSVKALTTLIFAPTGIGALIADALVKGVGALSEDAARAYLTRFTGGARDMYPTYE